jgi:3-oxoacyl-[acyl-carrier protein] reductase
MEFIFPDLPCIPISVHFVFDMFPDLQSAVVTGGAGSLGKAIAAALQVPDWRVASPDRLALDVLNPDAVHQYFQHCPVDLLVCTAGMIRDKPLTKLSESLWDEIFQVNFEGAAACAWAALPGMLERGAGHIIFISSFSAIHPPPGQAAYATAKAALLGLVVDLAARYGPSNIRVNAILPGFLETRMTEVVSPRRRKEIQSAHVLGRFNTCHEVARFVWFLHHELPHTSGQIFQLDSRLNPP